MAKKVLSKVKPALLVWARESAGFTQAEAAEKARVKLESLIDWESVGESTSSPSIPQLRKLADLYKRPLAVLYLPEAPLKFQALRDFRRLPGGGIPQMPAEVVLQARLARDKRDAVLALAKEAAVPITSFTLQGNMRDDPEALANRIREWLNVEGLFDSSYRDAVGYKALRFWRTAIENKDVLVLQTDRFSTDVVSGFAIFEADLPIIVISRKEAPPRRRLFSLLHELTHLVLRASGISDLNLDADLSRAPEDQRIEVFCNAVAAAVLLPNQMLLSHPVVKEHGGSEAWSDAELRELSRDFGPSREAVLRRLLNFKLTSKAFYERTRERFKREWWESRTQEKSERQDGIPRNMANEAMGDLGRRYVWLVLDQFYHDRLTLSDVAGHLGIKTKHIPAIERMSRRMM